MSASEQVGLVEPPPLPVCTRRSDENAPGPVGEPLHAAVTPIRPATTTIAAMRRKTEEESVSIIGELLRMDVSP
jgi:hypothetical protein